ncbi:MAG: PIN domain-containing protein [Anaerolineales bacterium]|nr:PIN domain-containing protein [Anaerolineales bacterium]MDP2975032.1 PIN domain-containing protein [Anaerolineales bacterium]MDP3185647.1 PIN domain-containing protein [Anaerolineales bacterium]
MNDKPAFQFVDSNILVYAYDLAQGEKREKAKARLLSLWESGFGCVSIQVLQEFFVNVTRKSEFPLSSEQAAQVIHDFSDWKVHRPGIKDVIAAIDLHQRYRISFWDAMILQSARQSGCSILWSEDLSEGEDHAGVKVVNPFKGK